MLLASRRRALLLIAVYGICHDQNLASSFAARPQVLKPPRISADSTKTSSLATSSMVTPPPEDRRPFFFRIRKKTYVANADNAVAPPPPLLPSSLRAGRFSAFWTRAKTQVSKLFAKDPDALPLKQKLKSMGTAAFSSYAFVQNAQMAAGFGVAWFLHASRTGLSPVAAGQWKSFLALYAGLSAAARTLTPVYIAAGIALAPAFQRLMNTFRHRWGWSKAATVAAVLTIPSTAVIFAVGVPGVALAAAMAGVPI